MSRRRRRAIAFSLLFGPALAFLAVFFFVPLGAIVVRSLTPHGFGFQNFHLVFVDSAFRHILWNTFVLAAETTAIAVVIAYPVACLLARLDPRKAAPLLMLFLLPTWIPVLARVYSWTQILGAHGVIARIAMYFGVGTRAVPFDLLFTRTAAVIGMVHYVLPYMIVVLYAGLRSIDRDLLVAARSLGATSWQTFRGVFFPLSVPSLFAGTLLVFVFSLGFFVTPAFLGGPHDTTIAVYIEQEVSILQWGAASAMGVLLLVVTLVGYVLVLRLLRIEGLIDRLGGSGQGGRGVASAEHRARFGVGAALQWTYALLALAFLLAPVFIVIPMSFSNSSYITFPPQGFSLQWYHDFVSNSAWVSSIRLSILVAAGAMAISTLLGLTAAVATVRYARRSRASIETLLLAPMIVPTILTAIAQFDIMGRLHLVGTVPGLIFGHAVLALPFTFIVFMGAVRQIDADLEAAAATLGANPIRGFLHVALPLLRPSVIAAAIFAVMISWDEVVVALFIAGSHVTLPLQMYGFLQSELTPEFAAVSTVLVGAVTLIVLAIVLRMVASAALARRRRTRSDSLPTPAFAD